MDNWRNYEIWDTKCPKSGITASSRDPDADIELNELIQQAAHRLKAGGLEVEIQTTYTGPNSDAMIELARQYRNNGIPFRITPDGIVERLPHKDRIPGLDNLYNMLKIKEEIVLKKIK